MAAVVRCVGGVGRRCFVSSSVLQGRRARASRFEANDDDEDIDGEALQNVGKSFEAMLIELAKETDEMGRSNNKTSHQDVLGPPPQPQRKEPPSKKINADKNTEKKKEEDKEVAELHRLFNIKIPKEEKKMVR